MTVKSTCLVLFHLVFLHIKYYVLLCHYRSVVLYIVGP